MTSVDFIVLGAVAVGVVAGFVKLRNRALSDQLIVERTAVNPANVIDPRVGLILAAAGAVTVFMLTIAMLRSPTPFSSQSTTTDANSTGSQTVALTRRQELENIKIEAFLGSKGGFGNVLIASFRIDNNNPIPVKDVAVTCIHVSNSGTVIGRNTNIIYEFINANSYHYVRDMNMGLINTQAERSRCFATDFVG